MYKFSLSLPASPEQLKQPTIIGDMDDSSQATCILTMLHEGEIRVVSLDSAADEAAPLAASLDVQRLGERGSASKYEALSYAWEDPTPVSSISLRRPLHVRDTSGTYCAMQWIEHTARLAKNLESALRHLRPASGGPRRLWVDALCIDQVNDVEKSAQVRHINKVFEEAERTLIWLGPSSQDSAEALKLINDIAGREDDEAALVGFLETGPPLRTAQLVYRS